MPERLLFCMKRAPAKAEAFPVPVLSACMPRYGVRSVTPT